MVADNIFPFVGIFAAFGFMLLFFVLGLYIYGSWALMTIANKTKTKNAWMAWIPLVNIYLITQIAKLSGWWTLAILLVFIPVIGSLALLALTVWWWWRIAERRKFPGWISLLFLIPLVNLVVIGVIAWGKK